MFVNAQKNQILPFRLIGGAFLFFVVFFALESSAYAIDVQEDVSGIAGNIVNNARTLPNIIAIFAYLTGLFFGVTGVLKLRDNVENPSQVKLQVPLARLGVGGMLLALPYSYNVISNLFADGTVGSYSGGDVLSITDEASGLLGKFSGLLGDIGLTHDFNGVLSAIMESIQGLPGIISAAAYMLGLLIGYQGLLKLRDHMENPDQVKLSEPIVRIFTAAAFLALPTVYSAMTLSITNGESNTGFVGIMAGIDSVLGALTSEYDDGSCTSEAVTGMIDSVVETFTFGLVSNVTGGSETLGSSFCGITSKIGSFGSFLTAISYMFGLVLGFQAILKLRDHALNPQNTPLSQGFSRLIAGGAFFALPFVIEVFRATVTPASASGLFGGGTITSYADHGVDCNAGSGLSGKIDSAISFVSKLMSNPLGTLFGGGSSGGSSGGGSVTVDASSMSGKVYCSMTDVLAPMHGLLTLFAGIAGTIFIMIGISRLMKSEQDGPRGPGGIGTIMTFLTGGVLLAYNDFMRLVTGTLFGTTKTATMAKIAYISDQTVEAHAEVMISALIKFMIMVGLISFVRGIFIIRGVAEGNNQASMMAGMTHIIGGAIAVNMGPFLNVVQTTFGISAYGVMFS